jgi:hypothetical protein
MRGKYEVALKSRDIFWDEMFCSAVDVRRRLGGTYCLHIQGEVSQSSNQQATRRVYCFLGNDLVQSDRSLPAFRRKVLTLSSESWRQKNTSKKQAHSIMEQRETSVNVCQSAWPDILEESTLRSLLLSLPFYPEDGDNRLLRKSMNFYRTTQHQFKKTLLFIVTAVRISSSNRGALLHCHLQST